jgi:hypothetical protein
MQHQACVCVSAVQWQERKQAWLDQKSMCWSVTTAMSQRHAAAGMCVCVSRAVAGEKTGMAGSKKYVLVNDYGNVTTPCSSWHMCVCVSRAVAGEKTGRRVVGSVSF